MTRPCHALAWLFLAWLITKQHLACCRVTKLNLIVCWCWLLNFSISFDSFTSLLTLISNQLGCLPSKLAWCCVMLCDHLTQCVKIVPFASCCVFTQSVMLSGVVLSRSASYYAVVRDHTLVRNVWCCAIAQCVVLCRVVLSRSASTCVVLLYRAPRRIVYCRAITKCVVLCGVTLSRSASYCVLSCYHALRRIVWGYAITQCVVLCRVLLSRTASYCFIAYWVVLCTVVLSRSASYCVGLRYHAVRRIV